MDTGRHRPRQKGCAEMHGTIQTIRAKRSFGFIRDAEGDEVFFHRNAVTPPEHFATLAVGMVMEFEAGRRVS